MGGKRKSQALVMPSCVCGLPENLSACQGSEKITEEGTGGYRDQAGELAIRQNCEPVDSRY